MILQFKTVTLCNFGSYANTTIDLNDKGFCMVSGENHFSKDNALSNGSGKSTIWSAICYALTGETIAGLTSNLKNINVETNECFVSLQVVVDNDEYIITRHYKPKSDLKIIKNSIDLSGKGLRESERILADALPDLTKDLIASTIIIGQGMPNKFSSFSPSGRKDLLEKLTKSDFMIEDIKTRLVTRQAELSKLVREYADSLLVNKTNLTNAQNTLSQIKQALDKFAQQPNFEEEILEITSQISELDLLLAQLIKDIKQDESVEELLNQNLVNLIETQSQEFASLNATYNQSVAEYEKTKYQLEVDKKQLQNEITKLKSITDTCPTCGQKLPDVQKHDTSDLENQLAQINVKLSDISFKLTTAKTKYSEYKKLIEQQFEQDINIKKQQVLQTKTKISTARQQYNLYSNKILSLKESLSKVTFDKNNYASQLTSLHTQYTSCTETITQLSRNIEILELAKNEADEHVAVVKKMETLIKRDFRGYLLSDIIKYIDAKAKEYCQTVFGTNELDIYLDRNSLDITYCGKMFDNLSGGEKQRCDIILQFAIRDLLQNYLNYSSNILVLDEIFDGLDKISTNKIIDLITNKLKDVESIFIISHHTDELELPVDSEIKVIKNTNGISEVK